MIEYALNILKKVLIKMMSNLFLRNHPQLIKSVKYLCLLYKNFIEKKLCQEQSFMIIIYKKFWNYLSKNRITFI